MASSEEVYFLNHNLKFSGTLYLPNENQPSPALVVVHPASEGEKTSPFYNHLKSELPTHGIAVLVFDRRGSGTSEGDFETADFEDLAGDVVAAVEYLESRVEIDPLKIGLHGTSQGGWIAPIAATRKSDIAFLIAVSACGVTPAEQMDYGVEFHMQQDGFEQDIIENALKLRNLVNEYFRGSITRETVAARLSRFESEPWFEKAYLYPGSELPTDLTQSKWYYEMDYEPLSIWKGVYQPTLFLFAETDEWVPVEPSINNYQQATSHLRDVSFRRINRTNHLMSTSPDRSKLEISRDYLDVLINWLIARGFAG